MSITSTEKSGKEIGQAIEELGRKIFDKGVCRETRGEAEIYFWDVQIWGAKTTFEVSRKTEPLGFCLGSAIKVHGKAASVTAAPGILQLFINPSQVGEPWWREKLEGHLVRSKKIAESMTEVTAF